MESDKIGDYCKILVDFYVFTDSMYVTMNRELE